MSEQRRPKVGDRVRVLSIDGRPSLIGKTGTVVMDDGSGVPFKCAIDGGGRNPWFSVEDLEVIPASEPLPRHPWDVLREAAPILAAHGWDGDLILRKADRLESAARPKPPTLREAVRKAVAHVDTGYSGWRTICAALKAVQEALAREDAA